MVCPGLISADHDPLKAMSMKANTLNHDILTSANKKRKRFSLDPETQQNDAKFIKMSKVQKLNSKYRPIDRGRNLPAD